MQASDQEGRLRATLSPTTARERLAKRVIEMGQKGMRNHQHPVIDAIARLTDTG
jgi:hypothetical protein